jgi:hypothetical protein
VSDDLPLENPSNTPSWVGRIIWVGLGLAIGMTILNVTRPKPASMNTDTRSAALPNDAAKIEFLRRYLKLPSEVQAAEFHIGYKANQQGMARGPSDFDIRAVTKVPPDKVGRWAEDMPKVEPFDISWAQELLPKEERWTVRSSPTFYARDRVLVVTFEPEGIVFKRVSSH